MAVAAPVCAYEHPVIWNVSLIAGEGNYSEVSAIPEIGSGDTIRIWGICGHTYEGGFTLEAPDVTVMQWEGSPVCPRITNTSHTAPGITITADNITLCGLDISGNSLSNCGDGAGILACGEECGFWLEKLTITACIFSENTVNGEDSCGGAIYAGFVHDILIENSEFTRNTASSDPESSCNGGACCFNKTSGVIAGTSFSNNAAAGCGGCCCIIGSDNFVITNTSYTDNAADDSGGGCMFFESDFVTVINTSYTNNTADDSGGGCMFLDSDDATVTHTSYTNNTADDSGGGCMFLDSDDATVTHTSYTNNTADDSGGGCMFFESDDATVTHTSYTNNAADDSGGGCMFLASDDATVSHTSYTNNAADDFGGGCMFDKSNNGTVINTSYSENTAHSSGGCCCFLSSNDFIITDTISRNCSVSDFSSAGDCSGIIFNTLTFRDEVDTSVSFTFGGAMQISGTVGTPPANPFGYANISHFVNVIAPGWMLLNISYTDADVVAVNASELSLWNTTGNTWRKVADINGVNTVEKYVFANLTAMTGAHTVAPFGPQVGNGTIQVNSTPSGASVYLNGVDTGRFTNTTLAGISSGIHEVTVEKAGYLHPKNRTVIVTPGDVSEVSFILTPVGTAPVASFTATPRAGEPPLEVTFTDTSTGGPEAWNWSFGDGKISGEQNPVHTYERLGGYTVSLTVTNVYGSATVEQERFVTVSHYTEGRDDDLPAWVVTQTPTPIPTPVPTTGPTVEPMVTPRNEFTGTGPILVGPGGAVERPVTIRADDMSGYLTIGAGVVARDVSGMPVDTIRIVTVPVTTILAPGRIGSIENPRALYSYVCTPEGVTFNPAISLTFMLSEEEWNRYGNETEVGWFNSTSEEWEIVAGVSDPGERTIMIPVSHFSTYALFADDVPEVALPTDGTGMPAGSSDGSALWLWGILIAAGVVAGGIYFMRRRQDK